MIIETNHFISSKLESFEDSKKEEIIDVRFGKKMQYDAIFPSILWKSIFLSLYFLTESALDEICENLRKINQHPLSLKDIGKSGVYRSSIYLNKVCGVSKCYKSPIWTDIINFNKIRNVLVHSDGIFSNENKIMLEICKKYDELEHSGNLEENKSRLSINLNFTLFALNQIQEFFYMVHKEMNEIKANR